MISKGQVTVGDLVTFVTYLDMLVWPLMAIGFLFNMVQRGSVSYNRINSLLEQESDITDPLNPIKPVVNGTLRYDIDFFRYDNEETLADIHFTLEKVKP